MIIKSQRINQEKDYLHYFQECGLLEKALENFLSLNCL